MLGFGHEVEFDQEAPLLEAKAVAVRLGPAEILKGVDLTLRRGELVAIVGPNGAGKSTFARAVCGLIRPSGGEVSWGGCDLRDLRGRDLAAIRAFIPQRAHVPEGVTVREALRIGRSTHRRPLQPLAEADRDAIEAALKRTGTFEFRDRLLTTLSGGELQRVQIAIGLVQGAPALIADEPTAQLDLGAISDVSKLLRNLVSDDLGVLMIVHDLALAATIADQCVVLSNGVSIATGDPHEVLKEQLIADVWGVDAQLVRHEGRSALHVEWLDASE